MPSQKQQLGTHGEALARDFLENLGYQFIGQQWHCRYGEIDLIMMDQDELVFIEVKLRSSSLFGHPEDMISRAKTHRLSKTALCFLQKEKYDDVFWRFDTIAITIQENDYEILHLKDTIRNDRL